MTNDIDPELSSLSEHDRSVALKRFYAIRPFIEDEIPLPRVASEQEISVRTLKRWVKSYKRGGLQGLATRKRPPAQSALPADMRELVEGLALESAGRTVASIKREIDALATEHHWPQISYHAFRRIVKSLDRRLVSLAHEGPKTYSDKYDIVFRRRAKAPNAIWQSDHTELDIWLLDENDKPVKPWLGVILDDYSRAVCGYSISFDAPSAMRTALMLRQAIWRKPDANWHMCGIPEKFYTDHGSDYTSKHMEQVAADIKLRLIFSRQGKPRGRGKMERFFGTVNELFLCHVPGNTITERRRPKAKLNLREFCDLFHTWLLKDYQQREHAELAASPASEWEKGDFLPRMPESLEQLDLLLLTVAKSRLVQPDGIHFQTLRYMSPVLAPYVREHVVIRYDPQDLAEIRVFHNNRFLCQAICPQLESQTISLKDIVRARNQQRKELGQTITERRKVIDRYINVHTDPIRHEAPTERNASKLKRYFND
ncbi:DDE-type integrase/transposase/recombinase [bacterium]|nr:DDE-type integrase/transposase/recombinase [bacterium]MBP9810405.1 DDE-type integrase/transposase/recombinase [bacterium]